MALEMAALEPRSLSPSRPLLVAFSGLDGAGKSTQIENLCGFVAALGLRYRRLAFWDDVVVFSRYREGFVHKAFGSEEGIGAPGRPVARRDKNVRRWYLTLARHFLYLLDAVRLRFMLARPQPTEVIVFDRYIHDELANLPLHNAITRVFVRIVSRLAPRPDLALLLDADPVAARARKPEYPVDFLQRSRMSYYRLAAMLGTLTLVPPLPIEQTCRVIEAEFLRTAEKRAAGALRSRAEQSSA